MPQARRQSVAGAAGRGLIGVVLAGGAGRRFGRGKAGLRLPAHDPLGAGREDARQRLDDRLDRRPAAPGPTLVEWAATRLATVDGVGEILVAAGTAGAAGAEASRPSLPRKLPVSVIADGPGAGPAAGVLGAAQFRPNRKLLVLACDLPLATVELLAELASSTGDLAAAAADVADPWSLNLTCALWTPPALKALARRVAAGDFRLYPLARCPRLEIQLVDATRFGEPEHVLLNVNTTDDWDRARRLFGRIAARPSSAKSRVRGA